ncbi:MAG: alpha/beta hydrolase [Zavarzinia sp.]|nr:alpha/beta hydrolase [Zavarzinia sp.]
MSLDELAAVRAALDAAPDRTQMTVEEIRAFYEMIAPPIDADDTTPVETLSIGAFKAEYSVPAGADTGAAILYFHGGGYALGSLNTHRRLARGLARAARVAVLAIDYRLAPENPYPAAIEDAMAAYRHLIAQGVAPARIAFAGDSAGGGLTVAAMLAAKAAGLPLPGAGFCISPWVDLSNSLPSITAKQGEDPIISKTVLDNFTAAYLGGRDTADPFASPLRGDLAGLPPLLIHVGSAECLLDDAVRLAGNLGAAGVETRLEVWPAMIHVWHFFAPMLSEGRDAIEQAGRWIGERLRP